MSYVTPEQVVDELTYRSYRYNRERFPEIGAARWVTVYAGAEAMERRYQGEINAYADAMSKRDREQPKWERDVRTGAADVAVGR